MSTLIINLKTEPKTRAIQIEMVDEVKIVELIPTLIKVLNYPERNNAGEVYRYWLSDIRGNPINQYLTPLDAGIENNSTLFLNREFHLPDAVTRKIQPTFSRGEANQRQGFEFTDEISTPIQRNISPQDIRGELNVPSSWKRIIVGDRTT